MKRTVVQPGAFPSARARELERAWLRQNWPVLALGAFGLGLVVVTSFLFICLFWERAWAAGTAGVLAGVAGTLLLNLVEAESGGLTRRQGADSEEFAHEALCKLEKKGWQVRSAVSFADGDVDHVVIGCDRVLVVETKDSNADWRLTSSGIRLPSSDPVIQVNQNLARVQRFLTGRRSVDLPGETLVMSGHAAAGERWLGESPVRG